MVGVHIRFQMTPEEKVCDQGAIPLVHGYIHLPSIVAFNQFFSLQTVQGCAETRGTVMSQMTDHLSNAPRLNSALQLVTLYVHERDERVGSINIILWISQQTYLCICWK
jgi:hypothetical protein